MEKNKENILFADLVARLPYGVKIEVEAWNEETESSEMVAIPIYSVNTDRYFYACTDSEEIQIHIDEVQPYLRKMSSMTEEEKVEYDKLCYNCQEQDSVDYNITQLDRTQLIYVIDWLNAHHFDHRGLIEIGLALEAPEDIYQF